MICIKLKNVVRLAIVKLEKDTYKDIYMNNKDYQKRRAKLIAKLNNQICYYLQDRRERESACS